MCSIFHMSWKVRHMIHLSQIVRMSIYMKDTGESSILIFLSIISAKCFFTINLTPELDEYLLFPVDVIGLKKDRVWKTPKWWGYKERNQNKMVFKDMHIQGQIEEKRNNKVSERIINKGKDFNRLEYIRAWHVTPNAMDYVDTSAPANEVIGWSRPQILINSDFWTPSLVSGPLQNSSSRGTWGYTSNSKWCNTTSAPLFFSQNR